MKKTWLFILIASVLIFNKVHAVQTVTVDQTGNIVITDTVDTTEAQARIDSIAVQINDLNNYIADQQKFLLEVQSREAQTANNISSATLTISNLQAMSDLLQTSLPSAISAAAQIQAVP